ncbi:FkbM family methyltransferase [Streptomyces sp. WZ-12]|uniref:FkbM family methyltransferase n=1 Tax=Streptomyces sp. WZ-12 TaxID=3030210 RepID=UPI00238105EF|nr:FkbM family methyltransferase [Streptomyces sp. WZ-12]
MSDTMAEALATLGRGYLREAPGLWGKAALAERLVNPYLRDHPRRRVVRTRFGARMAVDTQDLIQRYLYLFGLWEPHLSHWLRRRLRPGDAFIDVGANIGYFSLLAAHLVGPEGKVVSIEAMPTFHRRLEQHLALNDLGNVRTVNAAVSDAQRTLTFILASSRNMGAASIVPYDGPAEITLDVEAQPLPALVKPEEIAAARVIKIDVEGAEGAVVRGLEPLLARLRPDAEITVEVTPERMARLGDSLDELLDTMARHGFHTYRLPNSYAAGGYPASLPASAASAAVRWRGPVVEESDLVFSRVDGERLS